MVTNSAFLNIRLNHRGVGPLVVNIVLANLSQGILSFPDLMYNEIFTCMISADEWSLFAHPVENAACHFTCWQSAHNLLPRAPIQIRAVTTFPVWRAPLACQLEHLLCPCQSL